MKSLTPSVTVAAAFALAASATAVFANDTALPAPELKLKLDLREYAAEGAYFRGSSAHFGDLDNDGDPRDFIRHVNSNRMQAFKFTGDGVELLWDYESGLELPLPSERYFYKYVIWDLDGDGRSEVAGAFATAAGTMEMRLLDGATGEIKASAPLPVDNPESDHRNRALRMKTVLADLEGDGTPSELVLVDERHSAGEVYVFDAALTPLWSTEGDETDIIYAHYPWPYDLDGDGRDELLGKYVLDAEGTRGSRLTPLEWGEADEYFDHLDRAMVGDFMPERSGPELLISYEHLHASMLDAVTLEAIWTSPGVHKDAKILAVGEFFPEHDGIETMVEWAITDDEKYQVTLDQNGKEIHRTEITANAGYAFDWDGDRTTDEVFEAKYGGVTDVEAGVEIEIRDFYREDANEAHAEDMRIYMHALDMLGDYREEVLALDENELLIYGASGTAPADHPSPFEDPRYRLAVANQMSDNHSERPWFDWRKIGAEAAN